METIEDRLHKLMTTETSKGQFPFPIPLHAAYSSSSSSNFKERNRMIIQKNLNPKDTGGGERRMLSKSDTSNLVSTEKKAPQHTSPPTKKRTASSNDIEGGSDDFETIKTKYRDLKKKYITLDECTRKLGEDNQRLHKSLAESKNTQMKQGQQLQIKDNEISRLVQKMKMMEEQMISFAMRAKTDRQEAVSEAVNNTRKEYEQKIETMTNNMAKASISN